jgi:hypothetical protein
MRRELQARVVRHQRDNSAIGHRLRSRARVATNQLVARNRFGISLSNHKRYKTRYPNHIQKKPTNAPITLLALYARERQRTP